MKLLWSVTFEAVDLSAAGLRVTVYAPGES